MHGNLSNGGEPAIFPQGQAVSADGPIGPQCHAHVADRHLWLSIMAQALWGSSATAALFDLVGQHLGHEDDRTCRRWARGEREAPSSVLWMLIASKEGWRVVNYIGGEASWMFAINDWRKKAALADALVEGMKNAGAARMQERGGSP